MKTISFNPCYAQNAQTKLFTKYYLCVYFPLTRRFGNANKADKFIPYYLINKVCLC